MKFIHWLLFKNSLFKLRDGSVGKVLALQEREPESSPQNNVNLPGVGACACNTSAEKQEGRTPGARWPDGRTAR